MSCTNGGRELILYVLEDMKQCMRRLENTAFQVCQFIASTCLLICGNICIKSYNTCFYHSNECKKCRRYQNKVRTGQGCCSYLSGHFQSFTCKHEIWRMHYGWSWADNSTSIFLIPFMYFTGHVWYSLLTWADLVLKRLFRLHHELKRKYPLEPFKCHILYVFFKVKTHSFMALTWFFHLPIP